MTFRSDLMHFVSKARPAPKPRRSQIPLPAIIAKYIKSGLISIREETEVSTPEYPSKRKCRPKGSPEERKTRKEEYNRAYSQTDSAKTRAKARLSTPEKREAVRAQSKQWRDSDRGKEIRTKYRSTDKYKASQKAYQQTEKYKALQKAYYLKTRAEKTA